MTEKTDNIWPAHCSGGADYSSMLRGSVTEVGPMLGLGRQGGHAWRLALCLFSLRSTDLSPFYGGRQRSERSKNFPCR